MGYFTKKAFTNQKGEKLRRPQKDSYPLPGRYIVQSVEPPRIFNSDTKGKFFFSKMKVLEVLKEGSELRKGDTFVYAADKKYPEKFMTQILDHVGCLLASGDDTIELLGETGDIFDLEGEDQQSLLDTVCIDGEEVTEPDVNTVGAILDMEVVPHQKQVIDKVTKQEKTARWKTTTFRVLDPETRAEYAE